MYWLTDFFSRTVSSAFPRSPASPMPSQAVRVVALMNSNQRYCIIMAWAGSAPASQKQSGNPKSPGPRRAMAPSVVQRPWRQTSMAWLALSRRPAPGFQPCPFISLGPSFLPRRRWRVGASLLSSTRISGALEHTAKGKCLFWVEMLTLGLRSKDDERPVGDSGPSNQDLSARYEITVRSTEVLYDCKTRRIARYAHQKAGPRLRFSS